MTGLFIKKKMEKLKEKKQLQELSSLLSGGDYTFWTCCDLQNNRKELRGRL